MESERCLLPDLNEFPNNEGFSWGKCPEEMQEDTDFPEDADFLKIRWIFGNLMEPKRYLLPDLNEFPNNEGFSWGKCPEEMQEDTDFTGYLGFLLRHLEEGLVEDFPLGRSRQLEFPSIPGRGKSLLPDLPEFPNNERFSCGKFPAEMQEGVDFLYGKFNFRKFPAKMEEGLVEDFQLGRSRQLEFPSISGRGKSFTYSTEEAVHTVSKYGKFKIRFNSWCKGTMLGRGSFGTVYEGISDTGFFFAVKEVSLVEQGLGAKQCISQLEQEIALLSQFEHENIVQYLGTDQESEKLYIFLELVTQGSLQSLYQKYRLIDSQVRAYTGQILTGLKYLHDRNVMHRDIKCGNILVDAHGLIKLADFGLAKEASKLKEVKSCKGSAYWMAPEVINPRKSYWLPADIWSLGCTVLEMLTRRPPNGDLEWQQAIWKVAHGEIPPIPDALCSDAKDFIKRCLKIEPADRPSAAELLDHPFVKRSLSADVSTADIVYMSFF